ncbi:MAG: hypothetical protein ACK56F_33120 [bacterium]
MHCSLALAGHWCTAVFGGLTLDRFMYQPAYCHHNSRLSRVCSAYAN